MRSKLIHLVFLLTVLAGPALAQCEAKPAASLLLLPGLRPLVAASINGKVMPMLVDTGSEGSTVTPNVAEALKLPPDVKRRTVVKSVGGFQSDRNVVAETLKLGGFIFFDSSLAVVELDRRIEGHAAGVIGADLLAGFDIEIDLAARRLNLYRAADCKFDHPPWDGAYKSVSAQVSRHHHFLVPVEVDGHALTALFDTGSIRATVSRSAAAEKLGILPTQLASDPETSGTGAGMMGYKGHLHRFQSLTIGGDAFPVSFIDVVDFDPADADLLIGTDYMRSRRFFLSYSATMLFIQQSAGARPPPPPLRSLQQARAPDDACRPPPELLPSIAHGLPVTVQRPPMGVPEKVKTEHVAGCAAVMFHIAADGTPIDLKLVAESPADAGLGDFVLRQIAATKYIAGPSGAGWYYVAERFRPAPGR